MWDAADAFRPVEGDEALARALADTFADEGAAAAGGAVNERFRESLRAFRESLDRSGLLNPPREAPVVANGAGPATYTRALQAQFADSLFMRGLGAALDNPDMPPRQREMMDAVYRQYGLGPHAQPPQPPAQPAESEHHGSLTSRGLAIMIVAFIICSPFMFLASLFGF